MRNGVLVDQLDICDHQDPNRRNFPGLAEGGRLTCALPSSHRGDCRDLLLVREKALSIPAEFASEFHEFCAYVTKVAFGDRTGHQKELVNQLLRDDASLKKRFPNVGVAVHRFGPVPVFILPDRIFRTIWNGSPVEVRVAVHPRSAEAASKSDKKSGSCWNATEFVQSLEQHFPQVVTRYFGDVGAIFEELIGNQSQPDTIRWCRRIEDEIGASVKSKIYAVSVPYRHKDKSRQSELTIKHWRQFCQTPETLEVHERHAWTTYKKNWQQVSLAEYGRLMALLFVNAIYESFGVKSRTTYFVEEMKRLRSRIEAMHGEAGLNAFIMVPEVSHLNRTIRGYLNTEFDLLDVEFDTSVPGWCHQFRAFARYAAVVTHLGQSPVFSPTKPKVLIYGSPSEDFTMQVKHWFRSPRWQDREKPKFIDVASLDPGYPEETAAMAARWYADKVLHLHAGGEGFVQWDHSEGDEVLSSSSHATYGTSPGKPLPLISPAIEERLLDVEHDLSESRVRSLMEAYMLLFREIDRQTFIWLDDIVDDYQAPENSVRKLSDLAEILNSKREKRLITQNRSRKRPANTTRGIKEVKTRIRSAAVAAAERPLRLPGIMRDNEYISIIDRPRKGYYVSQISWLLSQLLPDASSVEIKAFRDQFILTPGLAGIQKR